MNIPVLKKNSKISKGVSHVIEQLPLWQCVTGGRGFFELGRESQASVENNLSMIKIYYKMNH